MTPHLSASLNPHTWKNQPMFWGQIHPFCVCFSPYGSLAAAADRTSQGMLQEEVVSPPSSLLEEEQEGCMHS